MAEESSSASAWSSSKLWLAAGAAGLLGMGALALHLAMRRSYPPQWKARFGDRSGPPLEPFETVLERHAQRFVGEATPEEAQKLFQNSQWREAAAAYAAVLQRGAPTEELYTQFVIALHHGHDFADAISVGYHALHHPAHKRTYDGILELSRTICNSLCNLQYYELAAHWLRSTIEEATTKHKADFFVAAAYCTLADLLLSFATEFHKTPEVGHEHVFLMSHISPFRRQRSRSFGRSSRRHWMLVTRLGASWIRSAPCTKRMSCILGLNA